MVVGVVWLRDRLRRGDALVGAADIVGTGELDIKIAVVRALLVLRAAELARRATPGVVGR